FHVTEVQTCALPISIHNVAHATYAAHARDELGHLFRKDRSLQRHDPVVGLDLDRSGMRHDAAERGADTILEHDVIRRFRIEHRADDRRRADGAIAQVTPDDADAALGLVARMHELLPYAGASVSSPARSDDVA